MSHAFGSGLGQSLIDDSKEIPPVGLAHLFLPWKALYNRGDAPEYGNNILPDVDADGNFIDFTMKDDANTIGHWIFDKKYHEDKKLADITDDFSSNNYDLSPSNFSTNFSDEYKEGTENELTNTFDWIDSNSDGLADGWTVTNLTDTSIVTGNGFNGNAQRIQANGDTTRCIYQNQLKENVKYRFSFKYRSKAMWKVINGISPTVEIPANTGDAIEHSFEAVSTGYWLRFQVEADGDWLEIDEIVISEIIETRYKDGGFLTFNGIDELLSASVENSPDLGTGDFTVEAWVRPKDSG